MAVRCSHGNSAPEQIIVELLPNQGGYGRHKCAICAYQAGVRDAEKEQLDESPSEICPHGNEAPESILLKLPDSQAGPGLQRHKCCVCAYHAGLYNNLPVVNFQDVKLSIENPPISIEGAEPQIPLTFKPKPNLQHSYASNKKLGYLGESFVKQYEYQNLIKAGREDLARNVEIVSKTRGDGLGYDVLSFTSNGEEKFIEVKTTTGGRLTPFYISRNEVLFSSVHSDQYYLYRLFGFQQKEASGKFYVFEGDLRNKLFLVSSSYIVYFE